MCITCPKKHDLQVKIHRDKSFIYVLVLFTLSPYINTCHNTTENHNDLNTITEIPNLDANLLSNGTIHIIVPQV